MRVNLTTHRLASPQTPSHHRPVRWLRVVLISCFPACQVDVSISCAVFRVEAQQGMHAVADSICQICAAGIFQDPGFLHKERKSDRTREARKPNRWVGVPCGLVIDVRGSPVTTEPRAFTVSIAVPRHGSPRRA